DAILALMEDWTLDELATSFVENGYWPQEALIVIEDTLQGKKRLVVVEGNRRLASLKLLHEAAAGRPRSPKWKELSAGLKTSATLFSKIPYLRANNREEVDAFLGFRHVTGIKEWRPAEKAEFITKLIEKRGMTYDEVRKRIGSKTPAVRRNYISYRLLLQMEDREEIHLEKVEEKFSVLFLSLRTEGVQQYLHIDVEADPKKARRPVPQDRLKALAHFARWLFGTDKLPPVISDSRKIEEFGEMLRSPKTVEYLERTAEPNYEFARRLAGTDEPELSDLLEQAADNIELALGRVHLHVKSEKIQKAVLRLTRDARQLVSIFPSVAKQAEDAD
ncbi:MAG: hypothetical protein RLZZ15_4219, partial [Verrucomicrobiota bacterium]